MGFLRHDTNNIIVDAVLTSKGREFLANNDGSFSIVKFALADDEVDYSIIKKYGRTVGKEKIEKNTPIMEALTNGSQSVKYRCLSLSPATFGGALFYPVGTFEGDTTVSTSNVLKLSTRNQTNKSFTYRLKMSGDETAIPEDFQSGNFEIEINSNLLALSGEIAEFTYPDMTAAYEISPSRATSTEVLVNPSISIKSGLNSTTTFNLYKVAGETYVRTYVTVRHRNSGISKQLEVQIYNTTI
jgi:hypothetical protein